MLFCMRHSGDFTRCSTMIDAENYKRLQDFPRFLILSDTFASQTANLLYNEKVFISGAGNDHPVFLRV